MDDELVLGVDVGTTGAKAVLFSRDGTLQAAGQGEYPVRYPHPGWAEQEPEDWWRATGLAIRQALAQVPNATNRVKAMAVSGQAPSLIALDENSRPLRPAMLWMDRRAETEARQLADRIGFDQIYRISGNRPDAYYGAAKLLWFKTHEPELHALTRRFTLVTGYINYRLAGRHSLDPVHAALLQLRDYADHTWSSVLCGAVGVEPGMFADIRAGHEHLGEVTREAAETTGLQAGTPVMVGTVDGSAAAIEAGAVESGVAAEMTGTSTVLLIPNSGHLTESAFVAMPHALPNQWLLLGAIATSGACLRWFRDQFGHIESAIASQLGRDPFDLLTEAAARVEPGNNGVIFLPYMMGERSPLWHTEARGVFFGLTLATTRSAVVRSILEGTTFALRHNVEVAHRAGAELREVRSVGGGTRSALWNQIKADVLGLPILLPETSVGAPFGDAVLAGMGLGWYPDPVTAVNRMVRIKQRFEPDAQRHVAYEDIYHLYRDLYEHLREDFNRAARIFGITSS